MKNCIWKVVVLSGYNFSMYQNERIFCLFFRGEGEKEGVELGFRLENKIQEAMYLKLSVLQICQEKFYNQRHLNTET